MKVPFYKYHGTGNDFILINRTDWDYPISEKQIQAMCDRHFGIGSDGLIFIEKDPKGEVDFVMNFYNPDGSQSFCGNGSRCAVHFAHHLGLISEKCTFKAIDGIHSAEVNGNLVKVGMRDLKECSQISETKYFLHTGSPHYIEYFDEIAGIDLVKWGSEIRYSKAYAPAGTNVNAAHYLGNGKVEMRTYERGVEAETLSCGTGVTAVALSVALQHPDLKAVQVQTPGGHLEVLFEKNSQKEFKNIILSGPAQMVFEGTFNLSNE